MQVLLFACAESIAIDNRRNTLSLFHLLEDRNVVNFPTVIPNATVFTLFQRQLDEVPEVPTLTISMNDTQLFSNAIELDFQGRTRLRQVLELKGLVINGPGNLRMVIQVADRILATWNVEINNIGNVVAQPALPLG